VNAFERTDGSIDMNRAWNDRAFTARLPLQTISPGKKSDGPWAVQRFTRAQRAVLIFAAWTAVGLIQSLPEIAQGAEWPHVLGKVIDAWAWALLTPVILLVDRKLASKEQGIVRLTLWLLLLSVPFSFIHTYLAGILLYPIPQIWWGPIRNQQFVVFFLEGSWQTYCAVVAILQAFNYYNRFLASRLNLERTEKTLIEARLNALRMQLEPHFLFNTFNAISSEISEDPKRARDMIEDLGALLRQSLDCKDSAEITLAQELALLGRYLSIQSVRFGDRLKVEMNIAPETLRAMVPSMLLQPLVENAIRHGIEGRMSGGTILVSASRVEDQLQIRIVDDGVGLPRNWQLESSKGVGVRVTRERLEALYPELDELRFAIRPRQSGGTEVVIQIPFHGSAGKA
jgi:two-component sensor histidine kinase